MYFFEPQAANVSLSLGDSKGVFSFAKENTPFGLRSAPSSCYDKSIIEKVRTLPMILSEAIQSLMTLQAKLAAYGHAMGLLFYDGATTAP